MRNRTLAAANARNRSTKSGFIGRSAAQAPELLAEAPHLQDTLALDHLLPEDEIVAVGSAEVAYRLTVMRAARSSGGSDTRIIISQPSAAAAVSRIETSAPGARDDARRLRR